MNYSKLVFAVTATIYFLTQHSSSFAQELTAVVCNARLPSRTAFAASKYDGDDTIYVFGGDDMFESVGIQTVKYSISQDILTPTAGQTPFKSLGGSIVSDKMGSIYYLIGRMYEGNYYEEDIFQYFPDTETFANVSKLHHHTEYFGLIQPDEDTALIIGGWEDGNMIQRLNLNTLESDKLTEIPKNVTTNGAYTSAIWVEEQGVAYIFDGREGLENVTKFDVSTNRSEILPNYFPTTTGVTAAVYDGRYGYIIGGSGFPYDGSIMQFDPNSGDIKYIPVHGYPGSGTGGFHGTSAVYVEKLNRIYMFGGHVYTSSDYRDDIWYISLDPISSPEPTTEMSSTVTTPITSWGPVPINCVGLGDAVYPFPGNCEKFVLCRNDQAYGFDCPEPLLFHQTGFRCTWPDLVVCE